MTLRSLTGLGCFGLVVVNPNEAKVVTLFGRYAGSVRDAGLWWVHPLSIRRRVSMRVPNFESNSGRRARAVGFRGGPPYR